MGHAHIQGKDYCIAPPGTQVGLVFPQAGDKPKATYDDCPVVGYFKSGMSEYDSTHVYVPLEQLQQMRLLGDGKGDGAVNQIQVKVKAGRRPRRAGRRSSRRRSKQLQADATSGSRPGSRSRGRCWRRWRSSRAS